MKGAGPNPARTFFRTYAGSFSRRVFVAVVPTRIATAARLKCKAGPEGDADGPDMVRERRERAGRGNAAGFWFDSGPYLLEISKSHF